MVTQDFLFAGHAIFTVSNGRGEHYTYKVTSPEKQDEQRPIWFISYLTGPNNLHDYTYLGLLRPDGTVVLTAKSKLNFQSKPYKVIAWAVPIICGAHQLPEGYDIQHVGRCGHCGRALTTPESVASGIGPICAGK
jgi:hypothetical protein